jgi:plasmid replication initiation protein
LYEQAVMSRRSPQRSDLFFAAAFTDVPVRDQRDTMERPFFSLAKKPRKTPIDYQVGDVFVRVSPNADHGIATIWDADILIWAATQITEAMDRGMDPAQVLSFHPYTLLRAIRRGTGGKDYERLKAAMHRLAATYIVTNIRAPKSLARKGRGFHWLEDWGFHEDDNGAPVQMYMKVADWLYDGIKKDRIVLTIHEDYFLLTGGIERWLYRVARKHAGSQEMGWQFTMRQLYEKSGSAARFSDFALDVRKIVEGNSLPEYTLSLSTNDEGDEIVFMVRRSRLGVTDPQFEIPRHPRRRIAGGITRKADRFTRT